MEFPSFHFKRLCGFRTQDGNVFLHILDCDLNSPGVENKYRLKLRKLPRWMLLFFLANMFPGLWQGEAPETNLK